MTKLETLKISRSGLETLPESISEMINLKNLYLNNLPLMNKLPDVIFQIESLAFLDLSGTVLLELPSKLRHLKNLRKIKLTGCSDKNTIEHWKKRCESWGIEVVF